MLAKKQSWQVRCGGGKKAPSGEPLYECIGFHLLKPERCHSRYVYTCGNTCPCMSINVFVHVFVHVSTHMSVHMSSESDVQSKSWEDDIRSEMAMV